MNGRDEISARIADRSQGGGRSARDPQARAAVPDVPRQLLPILPDSGPGCWPQIPVTNEDVPYVRAKQKELNAMLARQAAAGGATLVDAYSAGIGHDACQPPVIRWVEPVAPVNAAAPLHPNLLGMIATADAVVAAVRR